MYLKVNFKMIKDLEEKIHIKMGVFFNLKIYIMVSFKMNRNMEKEKLIIKLEVEFIFKDAYIGEF